MGPYQVPPLWVKVDLRVMVKKEYSIFPKIQEWSLTIRCNLMSYAGHGLKYCSLTLIILFNINHLFKWLISNRLNGFNCCNLSRIKPHPPSSSESRSNMVGYLFATKAIWRMGRDNHTGARAWCDQLIDKNRPFSRPSSPVSVKVE